jgi:glycogen debranching enzyme
MMRGVVGSFVISSLLLCACDGSTGNGNTGGAGGAGAGTGTLTTTAGQGSGFSVGSGIGSGSGSGSGSSSASSGGGGSAGLTGLSAKRYVAAGDRAYVIGAEDGAFPPMGWHIRGEMGGVWAHPIKLLDGYWFALDGAWLPLAADYTTGPGYVKIDFPVVNGFKVTRTEFSPDGSPAVLIKLTIFNQKSAARDLALTMDVRSELMAAYPWGWTKPSAKDVNGKDAGAYAANTLTFTEQGKPWAAVVGASTPAATGTVGENFWGPVKAADQKDYLENGNGTGAELKWTLKLPAEQEQVLWIAVAGSHVSEADAKAALTAALTNPDAQLAGKILARQKLLAQTRVDLPDLDLQTAFDWGKLNMADLLRTATDVQIRDVDEGKVFPAPLKTLPLITGVGAGFPDYPWLFGTDGAYTSFPLIASGQWDTASAHLRSVRDVSVVLNGATGKVVHEIVTDGSVYFGNNLAPGDSNETAEFVTAVDLVWRWTGDNAFRDEMYDFVNAGAHYLLADLDKDKDGFPEGYGMVERGGMGSEKLDVTAYTWKALGALERMAVSKGDAATATFAKTNADKIQAAFDTAWWVEKDNRYADSLCNAGDEVSQAEKDEKKWTNVCAQANQTLQQQHWINATPMEVALAPKAHAVTALKQLEYASGQCGLYHTGESGGPDGKGELKCWTLPTSVMAVAEANYGRLGDDQALFYMRAIAKLTNLEMPGALPEIAASPGYDPFADFRERAMFMQAWSSYGIQWLVIHEILGVDPDAGNGKLAVVPHIPDSWPGASVSNLRMGTGTIKVSTTRVGPVYTTTTEGADNGLVLTIGQTLPAGVDVLSTILDGMAVAPTIVDALRGKEVRVDTQKGMSHVLVVTTN